MERNSKEYENMRREISSHLRDFERNREWADFSNWLHRLVETLGSKKFPVLPQQVTLCKRLAQCLNPSLPAGVHTTALKVYENILQNFSDKSELLALTALGLLPYFQHANSQNKQTVLKIFDQHYVAYAEGIQMIVGLVNALLTVLNQNSQDMAKRVYAICDKINRNFGKIWVDGAVWINILKSPKVRLAGFKYFTKVFRDRDRALQGQQQKLNEENEKQKKIVQQIQKSIQASKLRQEQKYLLTSIYGYKNRPDQPNLRFPNFPILVLNALSVCLDSGDNMIKRAALDLLGTYLKLNSGVFAKREGVILVQRMLILLQTKEYSLTNRVYKYLFDQPNSEGYFHIDTKKKAYELEILRQALTNLLIPKEITSNENVFVIIEILIGDHPALAEFLLQSLAHQIIVFADHLQSKHKKEQTLIKTVNDFYLRVIFQYRKLFVPALLANIPKLQSEELDPLSPKFSTTLEALTFYFNRMQKSVVSLRKQSGSNFQQVEQKRIDETKENIQYLSIRVQTLQKLIDYLYNFRPYEQNESLVILDLCNDLLVQIHIVCDSKEEGVSALEVEKILVLLNQEAKLNRKDIYAKLLTLLPKPSKQLLLPYIYDNALSIVCINLLLGGDKPTKENPSRPRNLSASKTYRSFSSRSGSIVQNMSEPMTLEQEEQKKLFFAIFKLLNCHLFQARALEFIQRFKTWWGQMFAQLINDVQPSQWLIYWKRLDGDVAGGIVRMIENLQCLNSYHQHLSRKWIKESESIISKVLQAIYALLQVKKVLKGEFQEQEVINFRQWNIKEYKKIYNLLKLVFRFTSKSFIKFFYLQKDKYLAPFILYIFKCLENDSFTVKSESISMLTFILTQAQLPEEKINFLNLTLPNIISMLDSTITQKKEIEQKIELAIASEQMQADMNQSRKRQALREELVLWDNLEIQLLQYVLLCIKRVSEIGRNQTKMQEQAVICLKECNLYDIIMKGIVFTETYYIKRFYLEISKDLACLLSQIDKSKAQVSFFIDHILSKLHILLKNSDLNKLEQIIKSRNEPIAKESTIKKMQQQPLGDIYLSFSKETLGQHQIKQNLNLQEKYSEIIELWNTVKFYLTQAVKLQIKKLPTISLLSLVLKTFPLSFLKYTPVGSEEHTNNLQDLQEQLSNATGLKKQVFQIFQIIWNRQSNQILDFLIQKSDPRILIHSQLEPSKVLATFLKMTKIVEIARYLRSDRFNLPKNMLHYNLNTLLKENQLMFFLYMYLLYCNLRLLRSSNKIKIFLESLIDIFEIFKASPHVQTKLWLLQLIDLVGQRMLSSKQFSIEGGSKVREKLQQLTKELIDEMQAVISKSKIYTHRQQLKTGLFSLFTKQQKQVSYYDFVKMFPPTISQHFERYKEASKKSQEIVMVRTNEKKHLAQQPRQRVSQYLLEEEKMNLHKENKIDQFLFGKFVNRTEQEFVEYLSLCALRTLIRIGNNVIILIFDRDTSKINTIIREILNNILPISQNKHQSNILINQLIAQYLQTLLQHESLKQDIIRSSRKQIIEIYMKDDFFKCTQQTLAYWRNIIDHCTDSNDLLGQLLSKQGLLEGIFQRKAQGIRLKIKSFERVCFVIWSGKPDKYENKLRTVLQSLNEVMKQQQAAPALLILILFCIRILLMRLSAISLNKLFRSVWPSLITLLIQIFKKDSKNQKNPNLLLAGLKVIQLIHALELEDFMLHRWIFLFDYFGIKLDPIGQIEDNLTHCDILSPFIFKPLVTNCLPNNRLRCKFLPEKSQSQLFNNTILRRRLIVKKSFVESQQEVKEMGLLLMQYMMDLNECRTEIKKQDIQSVIEEDFISLDDYIFKIR